MCLCDAATDQQGKLNILGTFDAIHAVKFPAEHPQCAVAIRLRFTAVEAGEHKFKLLLVDVDGKPLIPPAEGTLNVPIPAGMESATVNLVMNYQRLRFNKPGRYSFDLAIDGREERSLPLFVKAMEQKR